MTDPTTSELRIREMIRDEVKAGVAEALRMLGIKDSDETRRDLDYLAELRKARATRQVDASRTVWQVVGGVMLAGLAYLAASLGFKGHP